MSACSATNVEIFAQHHMIKLVFLEYMMIDVISTISKVVNDVEKNCMQFKVKSDFKKDFLRNVLMMIFAE
jgi:hypothetical protein